MIHVENWQQDKRVKVAIFERDPRWFDIIRDLLPEKDYCIVYSTCFYNPNHKDAVSGKTELQYVLDTYGIDIALVGHKLPYSPKLDSSNLHDWPSTEEITEELRRNKIFTVGFFGETAKASDMPKVDVVLHKSDHLLFKNIGTVFNTRKPPANEELTNRYDPKQVAGNSIESHAYHDFNNVTSSLSLTLQLLLEGSSDRSKQRLSLILSEKLPQYIQWLGQQDILLESGYQKLLDRLNQLKIDPNDYKGLYEQILALSECIQDCREQFHKLSGLFPDRFLS